MRFDLAHRHERRHAAAIHERHEECLGAMAVRSSYGSVSLPDRTRRPLDASALGARSLADVRAVHAAHRACSSLLCQCRSEEHTSELQSLMRISYAVFCLKKKKNKTVAK